MIKSQRVVVPHDLARLSWEPLRDGVRIHRLYGTADTTSAALLSYEPGARVPRHRHLGREHVLVLTGKQCDDEGEYGPESVVINPAGSEHAVWSETGCLVFILWEKPIEFL